MPWVMRYRRSLGASQAASRRLQAGLSQLDATPVGWDRSVTVLTWADGNVGYRLEGKGVTLVDLVRVPESLS